MQQLQSQRPASIRGVVLDEKDKPIAGVTVSLDNATEKMQVDSTGRFVLANIKPGLHTLNSPAIGYQPVNQLIGIKVGEALDVELVLTRIAALDTNRVIGRSAARTEFEDRRAHKQGYFIDS